MAADDGLLDSKNIKLLVLNGNSEDNQWSNSVNKLSLCSDNCTQEKGKKQ